MLGREDVDLVRVYLQHIGKRKLLKAHEEVAIGERIETAQRDLVAALAEIPGAVQTLIALADRIRTKGDPAAELILLPEGGELRPEHIEPVLRAFSRIKRRRWPARQPAREARRTRGSARKTRAAARSAARRRAQKALADELAAQPIRPSLIDDIVAELRQVEQEFRALEHAAARRAAPSAAGRSKRASACRAPSSGGASRGSRRPRTWCARPSAS